MCAFFIKLFTSEYVFKIVKQKSIMFLSWSSWKSNKDPFLEYFLYEFWYYMKWKLDYSIFVLHIQFILDSLEFQVNQENIHLTLTILKVVLAFKYAMYVICYLSMSCMLCKLLMYVMYVMLFGVRSLVVSDSCLETKGSWSKSGC